jgi:hypothetical protein
LQHTGNFLLFGLQNIMIGEKINYLPELTHHNKCYHNVIKYLFIIKENIPPRCKIWGETIHGNNHLVVDESYSDGWVKIIKKTPIYFITYTYA